MFLISPGLVNYIGPGPPSQSKHRSSQRGGLLVLDCTLLEKGGTDMQTQILTHDATLECCCDVFKEDL